MKSGEQTRRGDTMAVVACIGDGKTRTELRPVPRPGAGEMLLALSACGLCGTDLFKLVNRSVPAATVLGHELVGRVLELGPGVSSFALGDRVVVPHHVACGRCALCRRGASTMCNTFKENLLEPGGFAERVLVRPRAVEHAAWRVPATVGDAEASFLEPAACVLRGVDKATLERHEGCALVVGGGTMGLLHLLVLRAVRPGVKVVVCDPLSERRHKAEQLGAHGTCPPDSEQLSRQVNLVSQGIGADAVFDTVGGSGPLGVALNVCRPGAAVVLFAHAAAGELAGFELNPFFKNEMRILATYSAGLAEQRRIAELLASGELDPAPLVSHRMPFSRFEDAVELALGQKAYKIMVEPDP